MVLLLLAGMIPSTDPVLPSGEVYLERPDPASGKPVRSVIPTWYVPLDPPQEPHSSLGSRETVGIDLSHHSAASEQVFAPYPRTVVRGKEWITVTHCQPPTKVGEHWRDRLTHFAIRGRASELVFTKEAISVVRTGALVAKPTRPWSSGRRVEILDPTSQQTWIRVGPTPTKITEYREDFDGGSGGGDVLASLVGNRLELIVTGSRGVAVVNGERVHTVQETIQSVPLDWLADGVVGDGYGKVEVRIR